MTPDEQTRCFEMQKQAVSDIVGADSTLLLFELMDQLIEDDWLGGIDALPGDIYRMAAFKPLPQRTVFAVTRRVGFFLIVAIQLIGPPLVFFQILTGYSIPNPDQIRWENYYGLSLSDWSSGFWSTKLMAFLFLFCFCINGLFVHMDTSSSWIKIDVLFRELNHCRLKDTSEILLKLGAFMNLWVITWLCLDTFVVLGTAETLTDVLLDSLGLMFIYNLDDIGGDFGLVNEDDWPGLQLAWLEQNIHEYASELDDVMEFDADQCCHCFLIAGQMLLTVLAFSLPVLFVFIPFQELIPDPLYEDTMVRKPDFENLVKEIVVNVTRAANLEL